MVQSVELTFDDASDGALRAEWDALAAAGLPSQARHTAPSNRPHVTLAALPAVDPACEPALVAAAREALPLTVRVGAAAVFGRDPHVLVRTVVVTPDLLRLHARVAAAVGTPDGTTLSPGRWTPHVTLARRLAGVDLPAALAVLPAAEHEATCVALRRWDGEARREWDLARVDR